MGFASNEFGTTGVWVVKEFQRAGLGQKLLALFHKLNPRLAKEPMGQMTDAGVQLTKSHHRQMVREALAEGQPVPPEVLADYPDLTKTSNAHVAAAIPGWMHPWLTGDCDLFALAFYELANTKILTGIEFVGIKRQGNIHHIGNRIGENYYDVRGRLTEEEFREGFGDGEVVEFTWDEAVGYYNKSWVGHYDELMLTPEMQQAYKAVRRVFPRLTVPKTGSIDPKEGTGRFDEPFPDGTAGLAKRTCRIPIPSASKPRFPQMM